MAKTTVLISDLTGEPIPDGGLAQIRIQLASQPGSTFTLDATESEAAELLSKATQRKKRGRKPKTRRALKEHAMFAGRTSFWTGILRKD